MDSAVRRMGWAWVLLGWWVVPAVADGTDLARQLDKLVAGIKPGTMKAGVYVAELVSGNEVFKHNADEPLKPASNMKILTVVTALDRLPPGFKYRTTLATRGDDLVVLGLGDPSVGDPRLARDRKEPITAVFHDWAAKLKAKGITEVKGNLVIDDSAFEAEFYNRNWPADQRQQWYSAPVGALNFNNNCIDVTVKPGPQAGEPAVVEVSPPNTYVTIRNECKTGGGKKGGPAIARKGDSPVYVVSGTCRSPGTLQSIAVPDPGLFFASACRTALAAKGIRIAGETRRERVRDGRGNLPPTCTVVAVHERDLTDILGRINKNSQNLFAECLLKTTAFQLSALEKGEGTGSYAVARAYVNALLDRCGVYRPTGVVLDDGCGLSPQNRVTPRMLVQVLRYIGRHPARRMFIPSLAAPGEEGTLEKRMKGLEGRVQAKTGYIAGVYALSGYAQGNSGKVYCFSILLNNVTTDGGTAKKLEDDICRTLVNDAPPRPTTATNPGAAARPPTPAPPATTKPSGH